MKIDPARQRSLLELARIDAGTARNAHRREHLGEDVELAEATRERRRLRDVQVGAEIGLEDVERDLVKQRGELAALRTRLARERAMIDDPATPEAARGELRFGIDGVARRLAALEEDFAETEAMRDALIVDVARAGEGVAAADARIAEATRDREEALADLDVAQNRADSERLALVEDIPAELLDLYDQQFRMNGVGAGVLDGNRCGACRMELGRESIEEFGRAAEDEVLRCPECGAILVRPISR